MSWFNFLRADEPSSNDTTPAVEPSPDLPAVAAAAGAPPDEPPVVQATELWAAWRANAVAAEDRWGGKVLRVSGKVERVERRSPDTLGLVFNTGSALRQVVAVFPDERREELADLVPGDPVEAACRVDTVRTFEMVLQPEGRPRVWPS